MYIEATVTSECWPKSAIGLCYDALKMVDLHGGCVEREMIFRRVWRNSGQLDHILPVKIIVLYQFNTQLLCVTR